MGTRVPPYVDSRVPVDSRVQESRSSALNHMYAQNRVWCGLAGTLTREYSSTSLLSTVQYLMLAFVIHRIVIEFYKKSFLFSYNCLCTLSLPWKNLLRTLEVICHSCHIFLLAVVPHLFILPLSVNRECHTKGHKGSMNA